MAINQIIPYTGQTPNKATQTKEVFADNVYSTHLYYDQIFVPMLNDSIGQLNQSISELNGQMAYLNYKGDWSSATAYLIGDSVSDGASIYVCKVANTNNQPSLSPSLWHLAQLVIDKNSSSVTYNNAISGLSATNVKDAIDEVAGQNTLAAITKSFTLNESYIISLNRGVYVPYVAVEYETADTNLIDYTWDIGTNGYDYDTANYAYATSIKPSATSGFIALTLGTGSFVSADQGSTIAFNGGSCILVEYWSGKAIVKTPFTNTYTIQSGSWTMKRVEFDGANGVTTSGENRAIDAETTLNFPIYTYAQPSSHRTSYNPYTTIEVDGNNDVFWINAGTKTVYRYDVDYTWNGYTSIPNVTYNNNFKDITATSPNCANIYLKENGIAFILNTDGSFHKYSITGNDLTTLSYISSHSTHVSATGTQRLNVAKGSQATTHRLVHSDTVLYSFTGNTLDSIIYDNKSNSSAYSMAGVAFVNLYYANNGFTLCNAGSSWLVKYTLTTAYDIATISSYTKEPMYNIGYGVITSNFNMVGFSPVAGTITHLSCGFNATNTERNCVTTNSSGQIVTPNWVSINSANTYEQLNGASAWYAISTDNSITFKIAITGQGVRNIARLNATVWEYNSNVVFASETWTAATINTKHGAIEQATSIAANQMTGTNMNTSLSLITVGLKLDLAIVLLQNGGSKPKSDGASVSYTANSSFKGAINGTHYEYTHPNSSTVVIKALSANNLKVRVL